MGKIEDAIKKINAEIQKTPNDEYLALIGEHIIDQITTDEAAEKVIQQNNSLQACLSHIRTEASKKKTGNVAVVQDSVVYGWARKFFGLEEDKPHLELVKTHTSAEGPKKSVHLSLDDFF